MVSKAILTTVHSGFNYGSSLQALAGKLIIEKAVCACELVKLKSFVKGRDVRLRKLLTIFIRSLFLFQKTSLKTYRTSCQKTFVSGTEGLFFDFSDKYLQPLEVSWKELKHLGQEAVVCFSGSDQIWNSSTMYVDPLYYLRFAPAYKRVAFSPSFGRDFIANYNRKKMAAWIKEYPYLSIRESSGVKLIKELTGKDALHLLDPTLIIDALQWKRILGVEENSKNYILAYFLDVPSAEAKQQIRELKKYLQCEVIAIPYVFSNMDYCDKMLAAGPKEFVDLVANAKVICTDSFHGTAFAINLHIPFYTFEREYGAAIKQSERVLSILRKVNMLNRYQPQSPTTDWKNIDFEYAEMVLNEEREKAYLYVNRAIKEIQKHEK